MQICSSRVHIHEELIGISIEGRVPTVKPSRSTPIQMDGESDGVLTALLEADGETVLDISVAAQDDDLRAGQLGTQVYKNLAETDQFEPRLEVTAKEVNGLGRKLGYFQAQFCSARYGTFRGVDACRIVLVISFQQLKGSRFKNAEIEIDFEDAANVGLNPFEDNIDVSHQPRVLDWEPKEFHGQPSETHVTNKVKLEVPISVPGGFVGVTPGISRSKEYIARGNFKVHGVRKGNPASSLHWVVREDEMRNTGIPSTMAVAVIVSYTPDHTFAARVRLRADIFFPLLRPVCGVRDDPIFFDPNHMKSKASKQPASGTPGALVPGIEVGPLDGESLQALTLLSNLGGKFVA